jgi:uridylate kinase
MYKELTYQEALEKHLNVMDQAAFSLCQDSKLPIRVFNFTDVSTLMKVVMGEDIGTVVHA